MTPTILDASVTVRPRLLAAGVLLALAATGCARNPPVEESLGEVAPATSRAGARTAPANPATAQAQAQRVLANMRSEGDVIGALGETNRAEIAAAAAAELRAGTPDVLAYARQMVAEHTAMDAEVAAIVQRGDLRSRVPDGLRQLHESELAALRPLTDDEFERGYVSQQALAHRRTLALVDGAIPMARDSALRAMLTTRVRPRVAEHLRVAEFLQRRLLNP